jgi:hypothetical protein
MKNYFNDNIADWLDGLLPDLIADLLQPATGYIYAPYVPLYTTPPDLANFVAKSTAFKKRIIKPVNPNFFSTVKIGDLPAGEMKRRILGFKEILKEIESFIKSRPTEVPKMVAIMKWDIDGSLKRLTTAGILIYDAEQRGWWRPEILDALAALGDAPVPCQ